MLLYWEREGGNSFLCLGLLRGSCTLLWKLDWDQCVRYAIELHRILTGSWWPILKSGLSYQTVAIAKWTAAAWLFTFDLLLLLWIALTCSLAESDLSALFLIYFDNTYWICFKDCYEIVVYSIWRTNIMSLEQIDMLQDLLFSDRLKSSGELFLVWPLRRSLWNWEGTWKVEL